MINTDRFVSMGCRTVTSRQNDTIVTVSKLKMAKYRSETGLMQADGIKLAAEALEYGDVRSLIISEGSALPEDVLAEAAGTALEKGADVIIVPEPVFGKISSESAPQGIIAVCGFERTEASPETYRKVSGSGNILILDGIQDPGNLGTIIRSAEAFGIKTVALCGCADWTSQKALRASMGSAFRVFLPEVTDPAGFVRHLVSAGRRVLAADAGGDALVLGRYETRESDCVVIGNEGHGISDGVMSEVSGIVTIPMTGQNESLNASQAAACILWEYARNRSRT